MPRDWPRFDPVGFPGRLGKRLRAARVERHMSQMTLADVVGLTPQTISNLERGFTAPSLFAVFVLAEALEVHPKDLLFGDEE